MQSKPDTDSFASTRWSLVAASTDARAPLTELCLHYWYPVFAQCRRHGLAAAEAQQRTQEFFRYLLAERLQHLHDDPPARFREWLQQELAAFLACAGAPPANPEAASAVLAPLPTELLEKRFRVEGAARGDEQGFRRSFALEVLARGFNRLRREAQQAGREAMFEKLAGYLTDDPATAQFEAIANGLGLRPLAVVVALKRLRQRYRELVDDELAETVTSAGDLEAERAALHAALRRDG